MSSDFRVLVAIAFDFDLPLQGIRNAGSRTTTLWGQLPRNGFGYSIYIYILYAELWCRHHYALSSLVATGVWHERSTLDIPDQVLMFWLLKVAKARHRASLRKLSEMRLVTDLTQVGLTRPDHFKHDAKANKIWNRHSWIIHESFMNHSWIIHESFMNHSWIIHESWSHHMSPVSRMAWWHGCSPAEGADWRTMERN